MAYRDFKDLPRRTASNKVSHKAFDIEVLLQSLKFLIKRLLLLTEEQELILIQILKTNN